MAGRPDEYRPSFDASRTLRLHYQLMPDALKPFYRKIYEAVAAHRSDVRLDDPDGRLVDKVEKIVRIVHYDNPGLFWLRWNTVRWSSGGRSCRVFFDYTYTEEECRSISAEMEAVARRLYDEKVSKCDHEYDVELAVHDYLASTVTYLLDGPEEEIYTAVGPLVHRRGVCDGISQATSYLLNCYGVRCGVLHGPIKGSTESHAWNVVFLGNEAYHLDVTWDLWEKGGRTMAFFNVTDEDMRASRDWRLRLSCDATALNYHRLNGLCFRTEAEACRYLGRNLRIGAPTEVKILGTADLNSIVRRLSKTLGRSFSVRRIEGSNVYSVSGASLVDGFARLLGVRRFLSVRGSVCSANRMSQIRNHLPSKQVL